MTKPGTLCLKGVAIAAISVACFAKTQSLTGKIVAYDPLLHAAKEATFAANKEDVLLETPGEKTKYVKVVFVGFGTTQIEEKYFDGTSALTVRALRDKACDEHSPKISAQVTLNQSAGTYILTDAFKNSPPKIKTVECYDAVQKK